MTISTLPLHPSMRHPLTGEPLRALYIDKTGRARFPIMGSAPDDPPTDPPTGPPSDPPADPPTGPPKDEPPADPGFPKDTPVAEMTAEQQSAYYKHQARKHEERNREWLAAAGGKTAAEIKAEREELAALRTEKMTESEKAVESAREEGRQAAAREYAPKMARLAFDTALAHVDEDARQVLIDSLDLTKVITDSGDIDTAKVKTIAGTLAPADKGKGGQRDFGGGRRESAGKSGVAAGGDMYSARTKKSTTTDS
jgi:hypothetical protein